MDETVLLPNEHQGRAVTLVPCIAVGSTTVIILTIHYYATKGCAAAREFGHRFDGRQVSDQMCCPVGRVVGAVGLPLTAVLGICGVWRGVRPLKLVLVKCCCSSSLAAPSATVSHVVSCLGLALLAVFDLCSYSTAHVIGAFFFFASGYLLAGLLCFSRSEDGRLTARTAPVLKLPLPLLAIAALPIATIDALTGEWFVIVTVSLSVVALEVDLRRGEAALRSKHQVLETRLEAASDIQ